MLWNSLEAPPLSASNVSTHNICFCRVIRKICGYPLSWSYVEIEVSTLLGIICVKKFLRACAKCVDSHHPAHADLGGSVGCPVRLEIRRSQVQPPPRSATFFRGDWSWNIFYGHSVPSADSRRAVVSFWGKNAYIQCIILVKRLEDSLPSKRVVR